uniref:Calcineurin-like phosphoesterase domain-containing protein n=1 Tax=Megaselia scalaris TaxID=36166 RepID=T1H074_MEGSC
MDLLLILLSLIALSGTSLADNKNKPGRGRVSTKSLENLNPKPMLSEQPPHSQSLTPVTDADFIFVFGDLV